ncbi:hypothetical protein R5R35_004103 [Gryllus longicercus]|uniref:Drebrin-like protein n=1 Tax=Gryllus longicercus TaxID=2509291 RepID=A0AAN9Z663_9ORTH
MAINLNKYRDNLLSAWKDVLDDKSPTDWALFGYEGQTNDLKVVSKGSGGIEEMTEDLNSGKIMYAFCKVIDPKTSLPKCVLINWQGEGAPLVRKGTCANHVRDVASFFKGVHVTHNARNEEEVDTQLIIDKVSKSTGSTYSFKERADHVERVAPIGTTYKKVIPTQEINSLERDKFWEKEEKEEKQRQEEERRRKEEERLILENERKQRELEETKLREERAQERNRNINQLREAESSAAQNSAASAAATSTEEVLAEREQQEQERRNRSELIRRQRSQEAQAVISQRTFDARAVFEQNTSAGQMHNRRKASLPMGLRTEQLLLEESPAPEPVPIVQPNIEEPPEVQPVLPVAVQEVSLGITHTNQTNENGQQEDVQSNTWQDIANASELQSEVEDPLLFDAPTLGSDLGLRARALYDYQAADPTEITFDPGDIITHIDQIDEGWWQGLGPDGTFGLFPANYVELLQ